MQALISLIFLPLALLNLLGGIVAGIWLAILGEWAGIGLGIAGLLGGALFCSLLLLPGFLISIPAVFLLSKGGLGKFLGFIIGMIGLLWTYIVMSGWGMFAFDYFIKRADASSYIPYLLWAYGVAIGPWTYMASKEQNDYSNISVFFLQIASAISIIMIGLTNITGIMMFVIFSGVMLFGYIVNLTLGGVMALVEAKQHRHNMEAEG